MHHFFTCHWNYEERFIYRYIYEFRPRNRHEFSPSVPLFMSSFFHFPFMCVFACLCRHTTNLVSIKYCMNIFIMWASGFCNKNQMLWGGRSITQQNKIYKSMMKKSRRIHACMSRRVKWLSGRKFNQTSKKHICYESPEGSNIQDGIQLVWFIFYNLKIYERFLCQPHNTCKRNKSCLCVCSGVDVYVLNHTLASDARVRATSTRPFDAHDCQRHKQKHIVIRIIYSGYVLFLKRSLFTQWMACASECVALDGCSPLCRRFRFRWYNVIVECVCLSAADYVRRLNPS